MGEMKDRYHCPKCDQDVTCMVHSSEGDICIDCYYPIAQAGETQVRQKQLTEGE